MAILGAATFGAGTFGETTFVAIPFVAATIGEATLEVATFASEIIAPLKQKEKRATITFVTNCLHLKGKYSLDTRKLILIGIVRKWNWCS